MGAENTTGPSLGEGLEGENKNVTPDEVYKLFDQFHKLAKDTLTGQALLKFNLNEGGELGDDGKKINGQLDFDNNGKINQDDFNSPEEKKLLKEMEDKYGKAKILMELASSMVVNSFDKQEIENKKKELGSKISEEIADIKTLYTRETTSFPPINDLEQAISTITHSQKQNVTLFNNEYNRHESNYQRSHLKLAELKGSPESSNQLSKSMSSKFEGLKAEKVSYDEALLGTTNNITRLQDSLPELDQALQETQQKEKTLTSDIIQVKEKISTVQDSIAKNPNNKILKQLLATLLSCKKSLISNKNDAQTAKNTYTNVQKNINIKIAELVKKVDEQKVESEKIVIKLKTLSENFHKKISNIRKQNQIQEEKNMELNNNQIFLTGKLEYSRKIHQQYPTIENSRIIIEMEQLIASHKDKNILKRASEKIATLHKIESRKEQISKNIITHLFIQSNELFEMSGGKDKISAIANATYDVIKDLKNDYFNKGIHGVGNEISLNEINEFSKEIQKFKKLLLKGNGNETYKKILEKRQDNLLKKVNSFYEVNKKNLQGKEFQSFRRLFISHSKMDLGDIQKSEKKLIVIEKILSANEWATKEGFEKDDKGILNKLLEKVLANNSVSLEEVENILSVLAKKSNSAIGDAKSIAKKKLSRMSFLNGDTKELIQKYSSDVDMMKLIEKTSSPGHIEALLKKGIEQKKETGKINTSSWLGEIVQGIKYTNEDVLTKNFGYLKFTPSSNVENEIQIAKLLLVNQHSTRFWKEGDVQEAQELAKYAFENKITGHEIVAQSIRKILKGDANIGTVLDMEDPDIKRTKKLTSRLGVDSITGKQRLFTEGTRNESGYILYSTKGIDEAITLTQMKSKINQGQQFEKKTLSAIIYYYDSTSKKIPEAIIKQAQKIFKADKERGFIANYSTGQESIDQILKESIGDVKAANIGLNLLLKEGSSDDIAKHLENNEKDVIPASEYYTKYPESLKLLQNSAKEGNKGAIYILNKLENGGTLRISTIIRIEKLRSNKNITKESLKQLITKSIKHKLIGKDGQERNELIRRYEARVNEELSKANKDPGERSMIELKDFFKKELGVVLDNSERDILVSVKQAKVLEKGTILNIALDDAASTKKEFKTDTDAINYSFTVNDPRRDILNKRNIEQIQKLDLILGNLLDEQEKNNNVILKNIAFKEAERNFLAGEITEAQLTEEITEIKKSDEYIEAIKNNESNLSVQQTALKSGDNEALTAGINKNQKVITNLAKVNLANVVSNLNPTTDEEKAIKKRILSESKEVIDEVINNPENTSYIERKSIDNYKSLLNSKPDNKKTAEEKEISTVLNKYDLEDPVMPIRVDIDQAKTEIENGDSEYISVDGVKYMGAISNNGEVSLLDVESGSILIIENGEKKEIIVLNEDEKLKIGKSPEGISNLADFRRIMVKMNLTKLWDHREVIMQETAVAHGTAFTLGEDYLKESEIMLYLNTILRVATNNTQKIETTNFTEFQGEFKKHNRAEGMTAVRGVGIDGYSVIGDKVYQLCIKGKPSFDKESFKKALNGELENSESNDE